MAAQQSLKDFLQKPDTNKEKSIQNGDTLVQDERQTFKRMYREDSSGAFSEPGEEFSGEAMITSPDTRDLQIERYMDKLMDKMQSSLKSTVNTAVAEALRDTQVEITNLKKENESLKLRIKDLDTKVDNLTLAVNHNSQYSRKNTVRIFGIPERDNEDCSTSIENALKDHIPVDASDIEVSHRIGARRTDKPRPIIAKFKFRPVKDWLIHNKSRLKGTNIVVYEDLSPMNRDLLYQLRNHPAIDRAWSSYGSIYAIPIGGTKHQFSVNDNIDDVIPTIPKATSQPQRNHNSRPPRGRGGPIQKYLSMTDRTGDGATGGRSVEPKPLTSSSIKETTPLLRPASFQVSS